MSSAASQPVAAFRGAERGGAGASSAFPCPVCQRLPSLTTGAEIWPGRPELADKPVWRCDACPDAYVGCHPGTTEPLGFPAGPELRRARMFLHKRMDPLWQTADLTGGYGTLSQKDARAVQVAARARIYRFLAACLKVDPERCHTAQFSLEQCRAAWRVLEGAAYPEIKDWCQRGKGPPERAALAYPPEPERQ